MSLNWKPCKFRLKPHFAENGPLRKDVGPRAAVGMGKEADYISNLQETEILQIHIGIKVGSHHPISIQLILKIFVCVMEFVGVHMIQFLHPIIS